MAGRTKKAPQVAPSNSLVASAVRYGGKAPRIYQGAKGWQADAYRHYGICGEARYAANYMGHALSKCTLFAAETVVEKGVKIERPVAPNSPAEQFLSALFNGREGQASMLKALGIHLTIAGECYLIGRSISEQELADLPPGTPADEDIWEVASVLEVKVKAGDRWSVAYAKNRTEIELSEDDVVIRLWNPMPGARMEADSPFRSLLPILTEIEYLTRHIFAQVSSRLTGAGILFISQGMSFPPPPERTGPDGEPIVLDNEADQFMATLAEAMLASADDDGNPTRVVPTVASVPADQVGKAELMHFWSNLDEKALEMRNDAIYRFARGMDLPPEKVLGMSSNNGTGGGNSNGVSHWGAWQVDEDTVKLHVEPLGEIVTNALTVAYLRVLTGGDERTRLDTSDLRLRPDRSKEAFMLWDRLALSTEALLREVGFEPTDGLAWDSDEFKARVLAKIASGSATPEQVQAANAALGVTLEIDETPPAIEPAPTRQARPAPSLEDKPTRDIPEDTAAALLLAVAEPLVLRALERAGNRLRSSTGTAAPPCSSYETHTFVLARDHDYVLADAWSSADLALDGYCPDVTALVAVLDSYCRTLLTEQALHSRERLRRWLSLAPVGV